MLCSLAGGSRAGAGGRHRGGLARPGGGGTSARRLAGRSGDADRPEAVSARVLGHLVRGVRGLAADGAPAHERIRRNRSNSSASTWRSIRRRSGCGSTSPPTAAVPHPVRSLGVSTRAYGAPTTSFVVIVDRAGTVAYTGDWRQPGPARRLFGPSPPSRSHLRSGTGTMLRAIPAAAVVLSVVAAPSGTGAGLHGRSAHRRDRRPGPEVGRRAPTFRLPWANQDGVGPADQPYDLVTRPRQDRGARVLSRSDFTSGCTAEIKTFARAVRLAVRARGRGGGDQHRFAADPRPVRLQPRPAVPPAERSDPGGGAALRQQRPLGVHAPDGLRGRARRQGAVPQHALQRARSGATTPSWVPPYAGRGAGDPALLRPSPGSRRCVLLSFWAWRHSRL